MTPLIIPTRGRRSDRNLGATGVVVRSADADVRVDGIDRSATYRDIAGRTGALADPDYPHRFLRGQALQAGLHRLPIPRHRALVPITDARAS